MKETYEVITRTTELDDTGEVTCVLLVVKTMSCPRPVTLRSG
jgi:hypothetical protein